MQSGTSVLYQEVSTKKRMINHITFRPDSSLCYGTEGVSLVVEQLNPLIVALRNSQNPFR